MSKFSNEKVEDQIRHAVSQITPDQANELWEQPVELASSSDWFLDGTAVKRRSGNHVLKTVTAIAACFLICVMSFMTLYMRADAAIYLDVNPSIELQINRFDRVVSAQASNADGQAVLAGMNLKNTDVDVALNAILGSMVKHGYLTEASGTILVSVECSNQKRADSLKLEISSQVEQEIGSLIHTGTVLSQEIETDDMLEDLAEKHQITEGKAALIQKLVSKYPDMDYEYLASLSMSELMNVLEQEDIDIADHLDDLFDEDDLDGDLETTNEDQDDDDQPDSDESPDADDDLESDDDDKQDDHSPNDND